MPSYNLSYKECLKSKYRLDDGSFAKAITKVATETDRQHFKCHCCPVTIIDGMHNLLTHVNGKRHLLKLADNEEHLHEYSIHHNHLATTTKKYVEILFPIFLNFALLNFRTRTKKKVESTNLNVEQEYEKYFQSPWTHPEYPKEWAIFWRKRYSEIKDEGVHDPLTYDYKPEWIVYWRARIEELKILDLKKQNIRIIEQYSHTDDGHRKRRRSSCEEFWDGEKRRRVSPFSSRTPVYDYEEVSFVTVCRLLVAIEKLISPLEPYCLKLLVKSINIQRFHPSKFNEIMMTSQNATVLETVREKLIGLIELDLVPSESRRIVPIVLKRINKLLEKYPVPKNVQEMKKKWTDIIRCIESSSDGDSQLDILVEVLSREIAGDEENVKSSDKNKKRDMSDEELIFLLKNVKYINSNDKDHLIAYMAKMQISDPERVKHLFEISRKSQEAN